MPDTRHHVGDIVTIRDDLVIGAVYFMDDQRTGDRFVGEMSDFLGLHSVITGITPDGKYRVKGSYCNWTDEMFVEQVPEDLPEPENLCLLYDFIA